MTNERTRMHGRFSRFALVNLANARRRLVRHVPRNPPVWIGSSRFLLKITVTTCHDRTRHFHWLVARLLNTRFHLMSTPYIVGVLVFSPSGWIHFPTNCKCRLRIDSRRKRETFTLEFFIIFFILYDYSFIKIIC